MLFGGTVVTRGAAASLALMDGLLPGGPGPAATRLARAGAISCLSRRPPGTESCGDRDARNIRVGVWGDQRGNPDAERRGRASGWANRLATTRVRRAETRDGHDVPAWWC